MSAKPRRGFAAGLTARKNDKTDNHAKAVPVKVALRREALALVGGADRARVLDLFAGAGEMHRKVWHEAAGYLGGDRLLEKALAHPEPCHHAQARVLLGNLDLERWNVFDLDAYGSPWSEVTLLAARRRLAVGERVALVLTDGAPRRAMLGHTVRALARLAGVPEDAAGAHQRWAELGRAGLAEAARRMGGRLVVLRQAAGGPGSRGMWYAVAALEGGQEARQGGA